MADPSPSHTSPTLLARLRGNPADPEAWGAFVVRYGPLIHRWCRHCGLQDADAEDVTQVVLLKLAEKMRDFRYDPARSFRAWLKVVTHHAWSDYVDSCRRAVSASGDSEVRRQLETVQARDDLAAKLEADYDRELLDEAVARVRQRIGPAKWEVFRLLAVEGLPGAEVAQRLGLKVATAYVIRSKVQKLIREEVSKLETPAQPSPEDTP
jgi:RNA polymerase sigma-70 factor (ECF subfamily)